MVPFAGWGAASVKMAGKAAKAIDKADDLVKVSKNAIEGAGSKIGNSVDDILDGATAGRVTKGSSTQYIKSGGYDKALDDFNLLNPSNVKDIPNGKVGTLPDGRTVNVRTNSSYQTPTLEIYDGSKSIKIRYDK